MRFMELTRRTDRQRGSVAGFIIISLVLTLLALVVLYGVKQYMRPAPAATNTAQQAPVSQQRGSDTASQQSAGNTPAPSQTQRPSAPQPSSPQATPDTTVGTAPQQSRATAPGTSHGALPVTGPADSVAVIAVGALAAASVAYVRSRRFV